jgi:ERF superfamily protein
MNKSDDIGQLSAALVSFQSEAIDASKDRKGYGYKYADLSGVLEVIRPLAAKHKIAFTQLLSYANDRVVIETVLFHESNQWISSIFSIPVEIPISQKGKQTMTQAQAIGCVITYARRYALSAIFGITQEDNDGASPNINYDDKPNKYKTVVDKQKLLSDLRALVELYDIGEDTIKKWTEWFNVSKIEHMSVEQLAKLTYQTRKKYQGNFDGEVTQHEDAEVQADEQCN